MPKICEQLPHGIYGLIVSVLATTGWIAALFKNSCSYALVFGDTVDEISVQEVPFLQVGLEAYQLPRFNTETKNWYATRTDQCSSYPTTIDFDIPWKLSKAFSFVGLVIGGGASFYLWISVFCRFTRGSWRWAGYEVAAALVFHSLSFLWFATSMCQHNSCRLSYGSKSDIITCLLWFVATILILGHYPKPKSSLEADGVLKRGPGCSRENLRVTSKSATRSTLHDCTDSEVESDEEIGSDRDIKGLERTKRSIDKMMMIT